MGIVVNCWFDWPKNAAKIEDYLAANQSMAFWVNFK